MPTVRHLLPILRLLGMLILYMSASMLLPVLVALVMHDGMEWVYLESAALTASIGALLWFGARNASNELQPRDGVLLVVLTWSLLPLVATIPLLIGMHEIGRPISLTHAYYEATSGLTTTGGTVLTGLDKLPVSLNFWRCFLQWEGGMGILVLVVAVLLLLLKSKPNSLFS